MQYLSCSCEMAFMVTRKYIERETSVRHVRS